MNMPRVSKCVHTGDRGHFLGFACGEQPRVAGFEPRIIAAPHRVAIYSGARTGARPPQMARAPRLVPLSQ